MGLIMYCMHYYLIQSWGEPDLLAIDTKGFATEYVITSVLVFVVQCFYINTVRALHAPMALTLLLLALALTAMGSGFFLPYMQVHLVYVETIVVDPMNHIFFNLARGSALVCDVLIVAALCYLLGMRKSEHAVRTDRVINSLMLFAVQRGILQAIVQGGEVFAYAIKPGGIYFIPFHIIISRIYCTSVLATLNARDYIAARGDVSTGFFPRGVDMELSEFHAASPSTRHTLSNYLEPPFLRSENATRNRDEVGRKYENTICTIRKRTRRATIN